MADERWILDADGHVVEPPDMWEKYLEAKYKSRAPRMIRDTDGEYRLLLEGELQPKPRGRSIGFNWRGLSPDWPMSPEQLQRGQDPQQRLADMDLEGIDVSVGFPTFGLALGSIEDVDFARACHEAYNNWLSDYCSVRPDRLKGAAAIPLQDVNLAIDELNRAVTELKMVAAFIRPNPYKGRNLDDPYYDPFYAEAQRLGVPIMTHEGTGNFMPTAGLDRFDNFAYTHTISHPFEQMLACMCLIYGGVCEKFPELQFVFLESGCSWLPYWLWRMDEHFEKRRGDLPLMSRKATDYFKRQCYISVDPDEKTMKYCIDYIGDDRVLFASDYPHWDAVFPGVIAEFERQAAGLSEESRRKILWDNAAQLYKIKAPTPTAL